jgi:hypothetical protein
MDGAAHHKCIEIAIASGFVKVQAFIIVDISVDNGQSVQKLCNPSGPGLFQFGTVQMAWHNLSHQDGW